MHELSIAMSLLEVAEERARAEDADRISCLYLRIGPLSGVVPDALASAFEIAAMDTMATGARLDIENVPITVFCPTCERGMAIENAYSFCCPECGTPTHDIRSGNELEITAMEIE